MILTLYVLEAKVENGLLDLFFDFSGFFFINRDFS